MAATSTLFLLLAILLSLCSHRVADGFVARSFFGVQQQYQQYQQQQAAVAVQSLVHQSPTCLNCVCINCAFVVNCSIYHMVETQHEQPHMTPNPTFNPPEGAPKINIVTTHEEQTFDRDAFIAELAPYKESMDQESDEFKQILKNLVNKWAVPPMMEIEMDVVSCKSFVEEKDCWIKNMPESIKRWNPQFVPS
mmetsp:Transcript_34506/g.52968  ORF Transcript_34506/g.52968 Transcript_34506/m.52968 type:complete len:193 (-) Transcript_34506:192-770(-)